MRLPENTARIAAGLDPLPAVRVGFEKPKIWDELKAVHAALGLIDYDQFKAIIRHTINCGDDYAAAAWAMFYGDRLNYVLSRSPEKQGYALINLAVQLAKRKAKEQP